MDNVQREGDFHVLVIGADHIREKLTSALSDPIRGLSEHDVFPMLKGQTGELLINFPTPNALRLNRSRFMALIAEGLDIQYSKRLSGIDCPDNSFSVTARFEDGTAVTGNLLIGGDGANSRVRELLLGPSKAALQPPAVFGCGAVGSLPAEISRKIRDVNYLYFVAYHPDGPCAFMANKDSPTAAGPEAIRQNWVVRAEKLAEPLPSAYLAIAPTASIWYRSQGLNNAILDGAFICRALNTHCQNGKPITEALGVYEKEMQERGRAVVIDSSKNSLMVHDSEQLKQSPVFTIGMKALQKAA
ncbi:MAG: hypothetical protein Q9173_001597 [Seirophora scorigena]